VSTVERVFDNPAVTRVDVDEGTSALLERRSPGRSSRGWLVRRALALADMVGLTLAFGLSMLLFSGRGPEDNFGAVAESALFVCTLPVWLVVANLYGLYRNDEERADHSSADDLVGVFHLVTVGSWFIFLSAQLFGVAHPGVQRLIVFWVAAIVLVTTARAVARAACRRTSVYLQNTIIVGAGDVGQLVAGKLAKHPEYGLNVLGFVDAAPKNGDGNGNGNGNGHVRVLGSQEELAEIVRVFGVERAIIAFSNDSHEVTLGLIRQLHELRVQIDIIPRLFEVIGTNFGIHTAEGLPLIGLPPLKLSRSALLIKRTLDVTLSLAGLILIAPLFAVAAVAIKLDSRGPVFFRQVRRGANEQVFRIYKFRTMVADAEERKPELVTLNKHNCEGGDPRMFKIADDPRTTRVGRVLRRYSLDELPQLLNVLKGEMSLVGPRPLILDEDKHVVDWRRRRLKLKPGITGLWQVLGRDEIPFEEMVKLDCLYVTSWSMLNDIKLILRTIPVVFRSHPA
jgi:exopolysaccharide biosynthesis polyprenyl glycosylphosphotransferase